MRWLGCAIEVGTPLGVARREVAINHTPTRDHDVHPALVYIPWGFSISIFPSFSVSFFTAAFPPHAPVSQNLVFYAVVEKKNQQPLRASFSQPPTYLYLLPTSTSLTQFPGPWNRLWALLLVKTFPATESHSRDRDPLPPLLLKSALP